MVCEGPKDAKDGQPTATYDIIETINNPGRALRLTIQGERVGSLASSKDGKRLARGEGNHVVVCCAESGLEQCQLRGHDREVLSVSWSPDGTQLASGSVDSTVRLWDASTGAPIGSPLNVDAGAGGVRSVSFSPSGDMVAAGCWNGKIHFMDAAAGQIKSSVRGNSAVVRSVCFSSDGKQLTSGSQEKTVRNWYLATRASLS